MPLDPEKLRWAKILTLTGGLIQLLGGLLFGFIAALVFGTSVFFLPRPGDIVAGAIAALFALAVLASLIVGAIVTYGAFQYDKANGRTWAIVITALGAIGFLTGAGFFLGALAALAGGILALIAHEGAARPA